MAERKARDCGGLLLLRSTLSFLLSQASQLTDFFNGLLGKQYERSEQEQKRIDALTEFLRGTLAKAASTGKGGRKVTGLEVIDAMGGEVAKHFQGDAKSPLCQ